MHKITGFCYMAFVKLYTFLKEDVILDISLKFVLKF